MSLILILMPIGQKLILCEFTGSAASNPLPQMPNSDQRKSDAIRRPKEDLNLVDGPIQESTRQLSVIWWRRQGFAHLPARREGTPKCFTSNLTSIANSIANIPLWMQPSANAHSPRLRSKQRVLTDYRANYLAVSCRVCVEPVEKDAVLCIRFCTVARSRCVACASPGCDLQIGVPH